MDNNNVQAGLANINAKTDINAKAQLANSVHNQLGGTTNYENKYTINILNNINLDNSVKTAIAGANQNSLITDQLLQKLLNNKNIPTEQIQKELENPEKCITIANANRIACLINNLSLQQSLAQLICKKLIAQDDFESLNLTQAIKAMEYLTENQLKILSLFYLLQSDFFNNLNVASWQELQNIFQKIIHPLIDINSKHLRLEYENLFANGCLTTCLLNLFKSKQYFSSIVRKFIPAIIQKEKVESLNIRSDILYGLNLWKFEGEEDYRFIEDEFGLDKLYKKRNHYDIDDNKWQNIINLYVEYGYDSDELMSRHIVNFEKYMDIINTIQDIQFNFTPIGATIAKEYLKAKIDINLD